MLGGTDAGFLVKQFLRREQSMGERSDGTHRTGTPNNVTTDIAWSYTVSEDPAMPTPTAAATANKTTDTTNDA
jgi:hypothetical protein